MPSVPTNPAIAETGHGAEGLVEVPPPREAVVELEHLAIHQ